MQDLRLFPRYYDYQAHLQLFIEQATVHPSNATSHPEEFAEMETLLVWMVLSTSNLHFNEKSVSRV